MVNFSRDESCQGTRNGPSSSKKSCGEKLKLYELRQASGQPPDSPVESEAQSIKPVACLRNYSNNFEYPFKLVIIACSNTIQENIMKF